MAHTSQPRPVPPRSAVRLLWRIVIVLVALCLPGWSRQPSTADASDGWQSLAEGIEYRAFVLPGPVRAYVARLDRSNPHATLDTMAPRGDPPRYTETVSNMASRYHEALNTWEGTWGGRNQVVAAINGNFFNPDSGAPDGGQVQSGELRGWVGLPVGVVSFGLTLDRQVHLGQCVYLPPDKARLTLLSSGLSLPIDGFNIPPERLELVVYTPQFTRESPGREDRLEIVIEMTRPALSLSAPRSVVGMVRAVRDGRGPYTIPFDHIVLSVAGEARAVLERTTLVGRRIGISHELVDLGPACQAPTGDDWVKTYAALSGGFAFLRAGQVYTTDQPGADVQDPRTAVCFNDASVFFVVVDGRQPEWSLGMTIGELAGFCQDTLGATWGINLDGGGSSTMWVNGLVTNRPSDGSERRVANGLMMLVHQAPQFSSTFTARQSISVTQRASLLQGPGSNYPVRAALPAGIRGVVMQPIHLINGVLAKGSFWWQVGFGLTTGWVPEDALASASQDTAQPMPEIWQAATP